MVQC
jgi:hypothetical protein